VNLLAGYRTLLHLVLSFSSAIVLRLYVGIVIPFCSCKIKNNLLIKKSLPLLFKQLKKLSSKEKLEAQRKLWKEVSRSLNVLDNVDRNLSFFVSCPPSVATYLNHVSVLIIPRGF